MTTLRKLPQSEPEREREDAQEPRRESRRGVTGRSLAGGASGLLRGEPEHHGERQLQLLARGLHGGAGELLLELDQARAEVLVDALLLPWCRRPRRSSA